MLDTVRTAMLERVALNAGIVDSTLATNSSLARNGSVGLLPIAGSNADVLTHTVELTKRTSLLQH